MDISLYRHFYAEEVAAVCGLASPALIDALAQIGRECFLPAGPWMVRAESDAVARATRDADPRHVYHNYSIAIDASRQLFNGAPGVVARLIDALDVRAGACVLHVGAGLGYYTALLAHTVGVTGRVEAFEADEALASEAQRNLADQGHATIVHGDAASVGDRDAFDAVLVSAGVTHPLPCWLDALRPGGRMAVPLTATVPAMGSIGKGLTLLLTKRDPSTFDVRSLGMTAIYSAAGIRDAAANETLGLAMQRMPFPRLTRLTTAPHDPSRQCWLHAPGFCLREE